MNKLMLNTIALDGSNVIVKKGGAGGGSGMPIVATEEELQALNLPVGSIASVAQSVVEETSFRNFYQPTFADLDQSTGSFVNPDVLNVVSQLKFSFSQEEVPYSGQINITFLPKYFDINNAQQTTIFFNASGLSDGIDGIWWNNLGTKDGEIVEVTGNIAYITDGVWEIEQEGIDALNDLLGNGEWFYFGGALYGSVTEEDFDILDKFCVAISNVTKADAYIKADTWQKLVKEEYIGDINSVLESIIVGDKA